MQFLEKYREGIPAWKHYLRVIVQMDGETDTFVVQVLQQELNEPKSALFPLLDLAGPTTSLTSFS
jgi:hypothetical protein